MGRILLIAVRNLWQSKRRTLLVGGALFLTSLLLMLMTGLSNGSRQALIRSATMLISGHLNLDGYYKPTQGQATLLVEKTGPLLEEARRIPGVVGVSDRILLRAQIVGPQRNARLLVSGIDAEAEPWLGRLLKISKGSLAALKQPNTALLFERMAEKLGVSVGDEISMLGQTARGEHNGLDLQVVAIARDVSQLTASAMIVSKQTARAQLVVGPAASSRVLVFLKDPDRAAQLANSVRDQLRAAGHRVRPVSDRTWAALVEDASWEGWTGQQLGVSTWQEEINAAGLTWLMALFESLTWALAVIMLVIIIVGLVNTLWVIVQERTREVGALRAIGMSRLAVLSMFMAETAVLSILGTLLGVLFGVLVATVLTSAQIGLSGGLREFLMTDTLVVIVPTRTAIQAAIMIPLITTLATIFPCIRAARIRPAIALRHAG